MPIWSKISFQDRNSPLIEHLTFFNDHSILILINITIIALYLIATAVVSKNFNRFLLEIQEVELFWTTIPALILIFIALPSLKTLYMIEENSNPIITIKAIGYQWYWSYEYSNLPEKNFISSIKKSNIMRLIETSNHLVIPIKTPTQIIVTSKDVIHSWTIPSLGVKVDSVPGRINQTLLLINRPGLIIGQCSEICGAGHSFMPISLEAPTIKNFKKNI